MQQRLLLCCHQPHGLLCCPMNNFIQRSLPVYIVVRERADVLQPLPILLGFHQPHCLLCCPVNGRVQFVYLVVPRHLELHRQLPRLLAHKHKVRLRLLRRAVRELCRKWENQLFGLGLSRGMRGSLAHALGQTPCRCSAGCECVPSAENISARTTHITRNICACETLSSLGGDYRTPASGTGPG